MKFVKFTAKEDTWFKFGTEVLFEDSSFICRRPTVDEYNSIKYDYGAVFVGIRVCDDTPNELRLGYKPGDERIDGEWCPLGEFNIEFVDADYRDYNWRALYLVNHGKKMVTCSACSGSGYYDNYKSPKCWSCDGTGKVKST